MADFAACEKNPFTQEVSRPILASLQHLSEIENSLPIQVWSYQTCTLKRFEFVP